MSRQLLTPVTGLQDKGSQLFNVRAYGAMGDGSTDDTAAIQEAIDEAEGGGTVYFSSGTYIIDPTTGINVKDGVTLKGSNIGYSMLKLKPGVDTINNLVKVESVSGVVIEDLSIVGSRETLSTDQEVSTNYGLYVASSSYTKINRVSVYSFTGVGIHIYNSQFVNVTDSTAQGNSYHGFEFEQTQDCILKGSTGSYNNRHGIFISPGEVGGTGAFCNIIDSNTFEGNYQYGVAFGIDAAAGSVGLTKENIVSNNIIRGNHDYGVSIYRVDAVNVINNIIENSGKMGIHIYRSRKNVISKNRFKGNSTDGDGLYDDIRLEGADDGEGSYQNLIEGNYFENVSGIGIVRVGSNVREVSDGDSGNYITGNYIIGTPSGNAYEVGPDTTYSIIDPGYGVRSNLRIFDSGIAISPNATLPGETMGIDAPFGTAALRFFNDNDDGNLQFVAPNGNLDMYLGGNNVFSVTSDHATLHDYKLTDVGDGVDPNDAVNVGQLSAIETQINDLEDEIIAMAVAL